MSLMDSPLSPRWVHGFVWNMHVSPLWSSPNVYARLAVILFLFLWCEQFFLVDAFFCFDVRFPSTCACFFFCCCCLRKPICPMLLYLGPLLSANTWHDRPLQICFKFFLGVRVCVEVFQWMCAWLTQHAHPQHEGIHGVGQTPGSPSCTWWEHHLLGLGLLTFYLCRQTSTHTNRQSIRLCRVHKQTDLTGLSCLFKVVFLFDLHGARCFP